MQQSTLWMGIAEAAINYIVVSTISSNNQKMTVTDLKTDLRTTKEDLMKEVKDTKETILAKIDTTTSTEIELLKDKTKSGMNGK